MKAKSSSMEYQLKENPMLCKEKIAYIPDNPDLYEFLSGIKVYQSYSRHFLEFQKRIEQREHVNLQIYLVLHLI